MKKLEMTLNQKFDGYYFHTPNADYFFVTDFCKYKRKNPWLVALIDKCLKDNGCTWRGTYRGFQLKDMLQKAEIELKTCTHGDYYSINGDGFSCGYFVKERETKIYRV